MKVTFAVVADAANISNGKFNLLGVFDQVLARKLPAKHPNMTLAATIEPNRTDVDKLYEVRVELIDPHNQRQWKSNEGINFEIGIVDGATPEAIASENPEPLQLITRLTNVPLREVGKHYIRILINGKVEYALPLRVNLIPRELEALIEAGK